MVYFDERPKENISDFYDREHELKELVTYITNGKPLILVLGLRRTGKTSLLKVALNISKLPYILIDCRIFEENFSITRQDFIKALEKELNRLLGFYGSFLGFLRRIKGVSISGFSIKLNAKENKMLLSDVLHSMNSWAKTRKTVVVFALDEAQELIKLKGLNILPLIAHAYDYLKNLSFVLTGSKIGLMYRFLKVSDPRSPLYGRIRREIVLKNLSKEQSLDYLIKGFEQLNIKPSIEVIEDAVNRLNGIIGWLTYFGIMASKYGVKKEIIDLTLDEGSKLILEELNNFLKLREQARPRYVNILYSIALNYCSWSEIKRRLEITESREISSSILAGLIRNLIDAGFIVKFEGGYRITDPIFQYAIRKHYRKLLK